MMIFTKLMIDNLYSFSNVELDLSIKRKISTSTIENENLLRYPNFRFKKVLILSGSNASGKTSLGKIMNFIQNLLIKNIIDLSILNKVNDKDKSSNIFAEFYSNDCLYQINVICFNEKITNRVRSIQLKSTDTYYQANKRLETLKFKNIPNMKNYFEKKIDPGWLYLLTNNNNDSNAINDGRYLNENLLYKIMHSFDSSIVGVEKMIANEKISGYQVLFNNDDKIIIDTEGNPTDKDRMSTGTYHSIKVAYFIGRIMTDNSNHIIGNVYYLDETMAYVHSDLERALVNLIIEKLPHESQFFYTTHNYDVLDMNIPVHSYAFLQKKGDKTSIVNAEKRFNKNDRKLFQYVKNNFFDSLPNTDLIDELL